MSFLNIDSQAITATIFILITVWLISNKFNETVISLIIKNILPIAIFTAGTLAIFYRSSPHIDATSLGTTETYGQLGDYIGGLLNPIFGFITILLLIDTLKTQRKQLDQTKNNDTLIKLENLLKFSKEDFKKLMESELLSNPNDFNLFSISSIRFPTKEERLKPEHKSNIVFYESLLKEVRDFNPSNFDRPFLSHPNHMGLIGIQKYANDIIDIYREIIVLNEAKTLKIWHYRQTRRFLEALQLNSLFIAEDVQEKLNTISLLIPEIPEELKKFNKWEIY